MVIIRLTRSGANKRPFIPSWWRIAGALNGRRIERISFSTRSRRKKKNGCRSTWALPVLAEPGRQASERVASLIKQELPPHPRHDRASAAGDLVILGRVVGIYEIRLGQVYSYSRDRADILKYPAGCSGVSPIGRNLRCVRGAFRDHHHARRTDRPDGRLLIGADIAVHRAELPGLAAGEYLGRAGRS